METTMTSQEKWVRWLTEERHISPEVIHEAMLVPEQNWLSIPVFDQSKDILFYKHRRAPWIEAGPKYRYDAGATSSLYGVETLGTVNSFVIITEGELDALAIRSLGLKAVSTTGGSGTWKQEWSDWLTNSTHTIIIAYDADEAGVRGALKVAGMTRGAHIAWIPVQYGKDPTEIIHNGGKEELLASFDMAVAYQMDDLKKLKEYLLKERNEIMNDPSRTPFHIDLALSWVTKEILTDMTNQARTVRKSESNDAIERAKSYPINQIIKVDRWGKALCPFHDDKNPSMHVYKDNHAYCFVCETRADSIAVYRQVHSCSFVDAVKFLST